MRSNGRRYFPPGAFGVSEAGHHSETAARKNTSMVIGATLGKPGRKLLSAVMSKDQPSKTITPTKNTQKAAL
jgi:hypothetical protein